MKIITILVLLAFLEAAQSISDLVPDKLLFCLRTQCRYMKCPPGYQCVVSSPQCGCSVSCKRVRPIVLVARACEGFDLKLDCNGKGTIQIVAANYGRKLSDVCTGGPNLSNTNCNNELTSRNVVISKCQNQMSCTVKAANDVFGDPCIGTYKYLEVQYFCSDQ